MRLGHLFIIVSFILVLIAGGYLARFLVGYHDEKPILQSEHPNELYLEYNQLLEQYATPVGMRHKPMSQDLLGERVYSFFAHQGPHQSPELFPTERDKLAYDINAYNALVHILIARNWPIQSPLDIHGAVELTTGFGFFQGHRFIVDGQKVALIDLDHRIVRNPAYDPRVRLVMACGGRLCPFVQAPAFEGDTLDDQLDASIHHLMQQERTIQIDPDKKIIRLLPILFTYRNEIEAWLQTQDPNASFDAWWIAQAPADMHIQNLLDDGYHVESQELDWTVDSAF